SSTWGVEGDVVISAYSFRSSASRSGTYAPPAQCLAQVLHAAGHEIARLLIRPVVPRHQLAHSEAGQVRPHGLPPLGGQLGQTGLELLRLLACHEGTVRVLERTSERRGAGLVPFPTLDLPASPPDRLSHGGFVDIGGDVLDVLLMLELG